MRRINMRGMEKQTARVDYNKVKAFYNGEVYEFIDRDKLRAIRIDRMYRPTDVARKLDIKPQIYHFWETRTRSIPADKFKVLCELLKVRPAELRPSR
jgi:DNA-binding Xre family transcriptional regulator